MTANTETSPTRRGNPAARLVGIGLLAAVLIGLLVLAFVGPAARASASGQTVAVTGDADLVATFTQNAGPNLGDAVTLVTVDSRDTIVTGIQDRDYIGGVVLSTTAPEVLTASAAGQVPTQIMSQITAQLQHQMDTQMFAGVSSAATQLQQAVTQLEQAMAQAQAGNHAGGAPAGQPSQGGSQTIPTALITVTTTDIVPLSSGDANGVGMATAGIPLSVAALLAGILISLTIKGTGRRLGVLAGTAILGGLLATLVLDTWLGVYPGNFGLVFCGLTLSLLGTAGLFVGLNSLLGLRGFGLAGAITLLAAVPWAALAVPYQFLPAHLGAIGQWLIPGATGTLARTLGYFPNASTTTPWLILAGWAVITCLLILIGRQGKTTASAPAAPTIDAAAA
ncbi:MAG: hypothetical protein FWD75_01320 [Propionibacteriaceae bacterium]|nr:hypothetical protein [Propionibacteriaceae bacterium]